MPVLGILGLALLLGLIYLPQFWIRRVDKMHAAERADFPGDGRELAEHLIEHFNIPGVGVEETINGAENADCYDPMTKTVHLSPSNYYGKSVTAVAVATHEVSHALQHYDGMSGRSDGGFARRIKLVTFAHTTDKFASVFFLAAPLLGVLARTPVAFLGVLAIGFVFMSIRILVHLVTLPVEYDASFTKALPILEEGGYLGEEDLPAARSVLKAAAFTYVAAALVSLIDVARWIRILR